MQNRYILSFNILFVISMQAMNDKQPADSVGISCKPVQHLQDNNHNSLYQNIKMLIAYQWIKDREKAFKKNITQTELDKLTSNEKTFDLSRCGIKNLEKYIHQKYHLLCDTHGFQKASKRNLTETVNQVVITGFLLSHNKLTCFPLEIEQLTMLTTLNVSNNKLTQIPNFIGSLSHLRKFDISHNLITELPDELQHLKALEKLVINDNKIKKIPVWIGDLEKLKCLVACNNLIDTIPYSISKLCPTLRHLDLASNYLGREAYYYLDKNLSVMLDLRDFRY